MDRTDCVKRIIETSYLNKEGHIASALSVLDAIIVLFEKMSPEDEFVLSKGHASLGLYVVLLKKGIITSKQFYSFGQFDSILGGHPSSHKVPTVKISTGSLGHGMPFAVGVALAKKIKKENGQVYCVIGDGEANEGTIWESALIANTYRLNNLTVLMDYNSSGERAIKMGDCVGKFSSFGWKSSSTDGHDIKLISQALNVDSDSPKFIQLNTIKGKGCKTMENNPEWHHKTPANDIEYQNVIEDVYS